MHWSDNHYQRGWVRSSSNVVPRELCLPTWVRAVPVKAWGYRVRTRMPESIYVRVCWRRLYEYSAKGARSLSLPSLPLCSATRTEPECFLPLAQAHRREDVNKRGRSRALADSVLSEAGERGDASADWDWDWDWRVRSCLTECVGCLRSPR